MYTSVIGWILCIGPGIRIGIKKEKNGIRTDLVASNSRCGEAEENTDGGIDLKALNSFYERYIDQGSTCVQRHDGHQVG